MADELRANCDLAHNRRLSSSFESLTRQLVQLPELHHLAFNKQDQEIEPFIQSYEYRVSPWPLVIDEAFVAELDRVFTQIPLIMHKVLRYFFTHRFDWTCEYLHIQPWQAELFLKSPPSLRNICARYDLVMSGDTIRLVEINSGGSLGGWQLSWLESQCFKAIALLDSKSWCFEHQNVVCNLLRAYSQSILDLANTETTGNILFYIPEHYAVPETLPNLKRSFRRLYKKIRPKEFAEGELYFFENPDEVVIDEHGQVYLQQNRIDAVILFVKNENELPRRFVCQLEAASLNGHFYFPDATNLALINNKLLFAFLHEPEVKAKLDGPEVEMVDVYIPWSTKLNRLTRDWNGKDVIASDWLIKNRQQLVIKKAHSLQGKDVFIGAASSDTDWQDSFETIADPNDWLVQKYMAPDPIINADPEDGLNSYDTVLGLFALSGKYAGGFIRGTLSDKDDKIINSARGACVFFLLEQKSARQKLVL